MTADIRADTWLVTGRHRVLVGDWREPDWRPFADHHARRVGSPTTLCGQFAVEWPMFWNLRFDPRDTKSCAACAEALSEPVRAPASAAPRDPG